LIIYSLSYYNLLILFRFEVNVYLGKVIYIFTGISCNFSLVAGNTLKIRLKWPHGFTQATIT